MANLLAPVAKAKFFDNNGRPADGYKLFTYEAGTSTKLDSYQNAGGSANTNPVILDFRGEANIWFPPNVAYKLVFAPPNDTDPPTAPIWTVDDIVNSELVTLWGGVDTGIANAYVLNFVANFTAYTDGIVIYWIPSNSNTGPSTINVNGLGPVPITNQDGTPLYLGQLQANQVALIVYRSTGFTLVATNVLPSIATHNANYTFVIGDENNIHVHDDATAWTWTVPTNASQPFPLASSLEVSNNSAETLIIAPAVGVTLRPFGASASASITMDPYTSTRITKIGTNTWVQFNQSDLVSEQNTFTGTLTGMTVATTGTVGYKRVGTLVSLFVPANILGTSNTTAMTMTGVPTSVRPKLQNRYCLCYGMSDNGVTVAGTAFVQTTGVIQFAVGIPPGNFTAAGSKGLLAGWNVVYPT